MLFVDRIDAEDDLRADFPGLAVPLDRIESALDPGGLGERESSLLESKETLERLLSFSNSARTSCGTGGIDSAAEIGVIAPDLAPEDLGVIYGDAAGELAVESASRIGVAAPFMKALTLTRFRHGGVPPVCTQSGYSIFSTFDTSCGIAMTPITVCRSA